jgi:predicted lipid-binding transport protein (Tim44 family)
MSSSIIQLLVLAGIALFLILRLRSVLGTRDGFEKPRSEGPVPVASSRVKPDFEVIEGGPDHDILDHVDEGSASAEALAEMKRAEPSFSVGEFLGGARGAYEMILMSFERGEIEQIAPFLGDDVHQTFVDVIGTREDQGLTIEANFGGVRELTLTGAQFDPADQVAEISVRFIGELTSVVRDAAGEIVEGEPNKLKRQKDIWTFSRKMGSDDPNWKLVATGE